MSKCAAQNIHTTQRASEWASERERWALSAFASCISIFTTIDYCFFFFFFRSHVGSGVRCTAADELRMIGNSPARNICMRQWKIWMWHRMALFLLHFAENRLKNAWIYAVGSLRRNRIFFFFFWTPITSRLFEMASLCHQHFLERRRRESEQDISMRGRGQHNVILPSSIELCMHACLALVCKCTMQVCIPIIPVSQLRTKPRGWNRTTRFRSFYFSPKTKKKNHILCYHWHLCFSTWIIKTAREA